MAFDTITAVDANGQKDIAVDQETEGTAKNFQAFKILWGPKGTVPTRADVGAGLPIQYVTKWSALGTTTTLILGAGVAPTLKALASDSNKLSNEFDNTSSSNRFQYADFELLFRGASTMVVDTTLKLWIIACFDGSNYEDGDDSVTPARSPDEQFYVRTISTQQRVAVRGLLLPASKFKILIRNESGVALTNTDAENVLRMRTYSEVAI